VDTENQTRTRSSVRRQLYLLTAAFVSGVAVMALELLGTRLLAPTFGLSLPV
jgi:hypothetical protein